MSGRGGVRVALVAVEPEPAEPDPWDDAELLVLTSLLEVEAERSPAAEAGRLAHELEQIAAAESVLAAARAERVARLVRLRAAEEDPFPAGTGAGRAAPEGADGCGRLRDGVGEAVRDEVSLVERCSPAAATTLVEQSLTLVEHLPATFAALRAGRLEKRRALAIAAELAAPSRESTPGVVAAVEAAALACANGLGVEALRQAVRRELVAWDVEATERRHERARRSRDVRLAHLGSGISELRTPMTTAGAQACYARIDAWANRAKVDGDPRPIGVLRAEAHEACILQPGDPSRPSVIAHLTVDAPLADLALAADRAADRAADGGAAGDRDEAGSSTTEAGHLRGARPSRVSEVGGQPVTAGMLRALLAQLGVLGPAGWAAPELGSLAVALRDDDGALRAVLTPAELHRLARRGCAEHPVGDCACDLAGPPPAVDRYTPTPGLYRFVRTRDRRCRFPGCSNRSGWSDIDHVLPHAAGGPTACQNLCCLCRHHHRLKTFARGWGFRIEPDGTLHVTTPSGITRTGRPPGLDPPEADPPPF